MTKEKLEKEATEYALEWGTKTDGTYACCRDGYLAGAEPREKRIEELEKENAELKYRSTKAREIIALGLRVCETSSIEYINLYQKRAEQFLYDSKQGKNMPPKDKEEYEFFRIGFPYWDLIRILRMLKNFEAKDVNVYYQDNEWE